MVFDVIQNSFEKDRISMSDECLNKMSVLRNWLFENVYYSKKEELKARKIVQDLFDIYCEKLKEKYYVEDEFLVKRIATDYVAGMTDRYAIKKYKQFFIPSNNINEEQDTFLYKLAEQNNLQVRI